MKLDQVIYKLNYDQEDELSKTRIPIGTKCSHITVIEYLGNEVRRKKAPNGGFCSVKEHWYLCKCDCGNQELLAFTERTLKSAKKGDFTLSCGCMTEKHNEFLRDPNNSYVKKYKYNARNSDVGQHLWHMRGRCYNPNDISYPNYGGRGIGICDEWNNQIDGLNNFGDWMYNVAGYTDDMKGKVSINRINNDKDYSPENCHLSYTKEQNNNTSYNNNIDWYGQIYTMSEFSKRFEVSKYSLRTKYAERKHSLQEIVFRKSELKNGYDRKEFLNEFPTNQYPVRPFLYMPISNVQYADIDIRDPRIYYEHPNQEQTMENLALQARLKAKEEGHPVKPFEYTNTDEFMGYNQYLKRL